MRKSFIKWSVISTTLVSSFSDIYCCGKKDVKEEDLIKILHAYFTQKKTTGPKDNITEKAIKNVLSLGVKIFNSNLAKEDIEDDSLSLALDKIISEMNAEGNSDEGEEEEAAGEEGEAAA